MFFLDWSTRFPQLQLAAFAAAILLLSTSEQDQLFRANMRLCHLHFYDFFALVSHSPLFIPLPFLCSAQAFLSSVFHFRCFCVVSFLIVFYGDFSCSFFFGCFFQSLYHLTQITFNFTCPLFVFHLCFKFLAQQCVSFSNSALTDFESGSVRSFFSKTLPPNMFPFLYFKGSSTKISWHV